MGRHTAFGQVPVNDRDTDDVLETLETARYEGSVSCMVSACNSTRTGWGPRTPGTGIADEEMVAALLWGELCVGFAGDEVAE